MTVTITTGDGSGSTSPLTILSPYSISWEGRNIIHDLIGGDIAVSFQTTRSRGGSISYLYDNKEDAYAAAALHKGDTRFTLIDTTDAHAGMTYCVNGSVKLELDDATLVMWILTVEFLAV